MRFFFSFHIPRHKLIPYLPCTGFSFTAKHKALLWHIPFYYTLYRPHKHLQNKPVIRVHKKIKLSASATMQRSGVLASSSKFNFPQKGQKYWYEIIPPSFWYLHYILRLRCWCVAHPGAPRRLKPLHTVGDRQEIWKLLPSAITMNLYE